jgi:hypothetical protein
MYGEYKDTVPLLEHLVGYAVALYSPSFRVEHVKLQSFSGRLGIREPEVEQDSILSTVNTIYPLSRKTGYSTHVLNICEEGLKEIFP